MVPHMKEIGLKEEDMVMENKDGLTEVSIEVNGSLI